MPKVIKLKISGKEQETTVDDRESLPNTLHRLGFASIKEGYEAGECGTCTVPVNEEAIDSCIYLSVRADGKGIVTVEDLEGPNGELNSTQKAFIKEAAVQCGFYTPGLIMSAVGVVGTGKKHSREELKRLISGHLRHYTGYENILNAMERTMEEIYRVVREWGSGRIGSCCCKKVMCGFIRSS